MRVDVNGVRLFFDVMCPSRTAKRCGRNRHLLLHGGPGFDLDVQTGVSQYADIAQIIYSIIAAAQRSSAAEQVDAGVRAMISSPRG
jgi:hypothetical protein